MNSMEIRKSLMHLGIPQTEPLIKCDYCQSISCYNLNSVETEDKKYINMSYCPNCNKLSFQILEGAN